MGEFTTKNIGARVKERRTALGLTQEQFADKYNYPRTTIAKIEAGIRDTKSAEIVLLAEQLGVSCDYLLGRQVVKAPDELAQAVNELYGLSESAINRLSFLKNGEKSNSYCAQELRFINELLSNDEAMAYIYPYAVFDVDRRMIAELTRNDGTVESWVIDGQVLLNARYDTVREGMDILRNKCISGGRDNGNTKE
jgi:transcriptional regulator with XRE-family HTH domain